jgi:hypothetical protein
MIPRVIRQILAPAYYLGERICVIWASRLKPHPLALENFGIRVVAPRDYGSRDNHGEVYTALVLLKKYEGERFEVVKEYIRTIFLCEMIFKSGYMQKSRICYLNMQKFSKCPSGTIPITIAGILVYVASFAKFNVPSGVECEEIKKICDAEEQKVVQKLAEILCE